MKKLIEIPDDILDDLRIMSAKEKYRSLKKYIQDILIKHSKSRTK